MYEPIGKSTQKYNYDMQEPTTPTASTAEVVSNTAKIPHEPLGIFIFKWIIILLGSSMLGMILVLFGQEIYHNIIVGGETHFREKCPVPKYVDFAYAVHVEKVEGINGTKELVQEDVFKKLVLQINESWMNLSKEDSIAMMIFKKCLVNGRGVFYCKDTKVRILCFPHSNYILMQIFCIFSANIKNSNFNKFEC